MEQRDSKANDWSLTFDDRLFEKNIGRITVALRLDGSSLLDVQLALPHFERSKTSTGALPQSVVFSYRGNNVFKGYLESASEHTNGLLSLIFSDGLARLPMYSRNTVRPGESLNERISWIAREVGLKTRFIGDFREKVPAEAICESLGTLLTELADSYGFFYCSQNNPSELVILRVGQSLSTKVIDCAKEPVLGGRLEQTANHHVDSLSVVFENLETGKHELIAVNDGRVYESISSFTGQKSYNGKRNWFFFPGQAEPLTFSNSSKAESEQRSYLSFAKQLLKQDCLALKTIQTLALPGETIKLTNSTLGLNANGEYFVAAARVIINSDKPQIEISAVRP